MWRPEFEYLTAKPAKLQGYHRSLSVFSHHYRGTPQYPGLVLGLDTGGYCEGLLYELSAQDWPKAITMVRAREMLGDVYLEKALPVTDLKTNAEYMALTYVANRASQQFAPKMPQEKLLAYIAQGQGSMGSCRQYVVNTILHLRQLGIHDEGLEHLAAHVI